MVKASKGILLEILTLGNSNTEKLMGKEFTLGKTEKCMMENGIKELNRDMESGKASRMILILENGVHQKPMVMEFIHGRMEIGTKANGKCV
jgi:hypothetical protein